MTPENTLRRGLAGRRALLMQRLRLMLCNADDEEDDRATGLLDAGDDFGLGGEGTYETIEVGDDDDVGRFEVALELLYDEFQFLAALEREIMQAEIQDLELKAIARRWL